MGAGVSMCGRFGGAGEGGQYLEVDDVELVVLRWWVSC